MSEKFSSKQDWRDYEDKRSEKRADKWEEIDFDSYPRMQGETSEEYGQRLKNMHKKMSEWEQGSADGESQGSPDKIRELVMRKLELGVYTPEEAEALIERLTRRMEQRKEDKRYEAWQEGNADEMSERLEERGQVGFAEKVANDIREKVDEEIIKKALASGDNSEVFAILARLPKREGIRDEQDRREYEEELARRTAEGHDRYDAVIGEAMVILQNEVFGETAIDASENSENLGEGAETEKTREEMFAELLSPEGAKWLYEEMGVESISDVKNLTDEELKDLYEKWAGRNTEEAEIEKSREEMLGELFGMEGAKWISEVMGIQSMSEVKNLSDEELRNLYAQWTEYKNKDEAGEEAEEADEKKSLIAVNLDRTRDAEAAARDIAERMLREDLADGGKLKRLIKSIWRGNLFRGYYVEKNKKLAYERILEKQGGEDGELADHDWQSRSEATIDRFISEYDEMIHEKAGEWKNALPEDHPAAVAAKEAISKFARGEVDEANFTEEMDRVKAMLRDEKGNSKGEVVLDNYLELARAAKGRFEHEEGIESIMEGFKLINGEARANVRTEAHLKALDKLMDRYEHSKFGRFLPPEIVAGAASVGVWLAQAGAKSAVRAATLGLGGAVVTGVVAGMKEGSRVSTDRAQMSREMASGLAPGASKYDKAVGETLYAMTDATKLTGDLRAAIESGDRATLAGVLAVAETRTKMSDERNIDLICYSDPTRVEEERFALDLARAEARVKLRELAPNADDALNQTMGAVEKILDEGTEGAPGIKARDAAFKKLRRKQMIKQGIKTGVVAAGTMIVSQEVMAAFDPNSYGIADKVFNLKNNADANNTLLAGMLGFKGPDGLAIIGSERIDAQEANGVKLTDEQVAQLKQEGYTVNRFETNTLESRDIDMSASEYAREYGTEVGRDGWGSNGTTAFDGNELRAHYTTNGDGIVTRMTGNSTTWGGETIDFDQAVSEGKIKAFISLTGDSQKTPLEVTGQLVSNGSQLEFIPEPGTVAAECFQDGKFIGKYFEVAFDNGVTEDGVQHMIPLATVVGRGMENAVLPATVEVPVTDVLYNVIGFDQVTEKAGEAAAERLTGLGIMLPFVRRDNLSRARRRERSGDTAPAPTPPTLGGREIAKSETTISEPEDREVRQPEGTGENEAPAEKPAESEGGEGTSPEAPESEQSTEPESIEERGEYGEDGEPNWEVLRDQIGGEQGVWLVNGGMDTAPESWRNYQYEQWWDGLSDEIKDRFSGKSADRLSPESDTLYDWLWATGKALSAEEIYGETAEVYESTWNAMNDRQKEDIREGRFVPNNQYFVNWLRDNGIIPAEGENNEAA
ncbi:MAG: hypothetical protein LBT19_01945 [Candidatus Nomurabacteria bacterium]|jgi:hypothetical protein|nr:hypothetical protein [Candidatus Nomurabacteria bacterium]